jgi:hypothetical protein
MRETTFTQLEQRIRKFASSPTAQAKTRKLIQNQDGVSMLELCLLLPVILIFVVGIVDFGSRINGIKLISTAARHGTRIASAHSRRVTDGIPCGVSGTPIQTSCGGPAVQIVNAPTTTVKSVALDATCNFIRNSKLDGENYQVISDTFLRTEDGVDFKFVKVKIKERAQSCILCFSGLYSSFEIQDTSTFMLEGNCVG